MNLAVWYLFVISLVLAILQTGCSQGPDASVATPSNGVEVGNGRHASFVSPRYRIRVSYPSSLSVRIVSDEEFEVSNGEDLPVGVPASFVRFQIFPGGTIGAHTIRTQSELSAYTHQAHPSLQFQTASLSRTRGFAWKRNTDATSESIHYLLTPSHDLIYIQAQGYREGDGLKAMESVVESFTYDDLPPAMKVFKLEPATMETPSVRRFELIAEDGQSGLQESAAVVLNPLTAAPSAGPYESIQSMVAKGNGRYHIDLPLPRLAPGKYAVKQITLWDRVGNSVTYVFSLPQSTREPAKRKTGEVEWVGEPILLDIDAMQTSTVVKPQIVQLKISSNQIEVGDPATIQFQLAGDKRHGAYRTWIELRETNAPEKSISGLRFSAEAAPLGDSWFATKFETSEGMSGGSFFVHSLEVESKSGGERLNLRGVPADEGYQGADGPKLPILKFKVSYREGSDIKRPLVDGLKFSQANVRAGEKVDLLIHALDDISGIAPFSGYAGKISLEENSIAAAKSKIVLKGAWKNVGDNWYSLTIAVPEDALPGAYFLELLLVSDRAGNTERMGLASPLKDRTPSEKIELQNSTGGKILSPILEITTKP